MMHIAVLNLKTSINITGAFLHNPVFSPAPLVCVRGGTMRLLNVHTLELESFHAQIPPYAILSHTWGSEEVSFQEYGTVGAKRKTGYQKILQTCEQAKRDGHRYVWIDTCSIDKSSSAELSESINSMFRWYQASVVCYAFLDDIHEGHELGKARWFKRGWTLQELLAPGEVIFFNWDWNKMGTREDLWLLISKITGIDRRALVGDDVGRRSTVPRMSSTLAYVRTASIAQRMMWASKRSTTRAEDIAYCLFGIFDVNMPLLYGEGGKKAFQRLQEEIIKQSTDHSILVWYPKNHLMSGPLQGPLADHPRRFSHVGAIIGSKAHVDPFSMNNNGLQIRLPMFRGEGARNLWIAILSCFWEGQLRNHVGIPLIAVDASGRVFLRSSGSLWRVDSNHLKQAKMKDICLLRHETSQHQNRNLFSMRVGPAASMTFGERRYLTQIGNLSKSQQTLEISEPNTDRSFGVALSRSGKDRHNLTVVIVDMLKGCDYTSHLSIHCVRASEHMTDGALLSLSKSDSAGLPKRTCTVRISQSDTLVASISWKHIAGHNVLALDIELKHSLILQNLEWTRTTVRNNMLRYGMFRCSALLFLASAAIWILVTNFVWIPGQIMKIVCLGFIGGFVALYVVKPTINAMSHRQDRSGLTLKKEGAYVVFLILAFGFVTLDGLVEAFTPIERVGRWVIISFVTYGIPSYLILYNLYSIR